jgi:hypothetical protein
MPTSSPTEAIRRQVINVVSFAFAAGLVLMQAAANWVRGERLLTALFLLSFAWLMFGIVVVSRRILKSVSWASRGGGSTTWLNPLRLKGGNDGAL